MLGSWVSINLYLTLHGDPILAGVCILELLVTGEECGGEKEIQAVSDGSKVLQKHHICGEAKV